MLFSCCACIPNVVSPCTRDFSFSFLFLSLLFFFFFFLLLPPPLSLSLTGRSVNPRIRGCRGHRGRSPRLSSPCRLRFISASKQDGLPRVESKYKNATNQYRARALVRDVSDKYRTDYLERLRSRAHVCHS